MRGPPIDPHTAPLTGALITAAALLSSSAAAHRAARPVVLDMYILRSQPAAPSATAWTAACRWSAIAASWCTSLQVEHDPFDRTCEGEGCFVLIGTVDHQAIIATDVHPRIGT